MTHFRTFTIAAALALPMLATQAQAGCLTGALVGGVAGKLVGHGYAGAAAGCAIGVHRKNQKEELRNSEIQNGRSVTRDQNRY